MKTTIKNKPISAAHFAMMVIGIAFLFFGLSVFFQFYDRQALIIHAMSLCGISALTYLITREHLLKRQ